MNTFLLRLNKFLRFISFPFTRLTAKQRKSLALMRRDNARARIHYRPGGGKGWEKLVAEFDATFRFQGIRDVQQQSFNSRFAAFPPGNPVYYSIACNLMLLRLRERDKWGVIDRLKSTQGDCVRAYERSFGGFVVTWDLLISISAIFSIAEVDSTIVDKSCTGLDLGAGWGRVGHALLRINPSVKYICADLPETLLVSQSYLPTTLDGVRVSSYEDNIDNITLDEPGLTFIGSHDLDRLEANSIDFFINIASFQEMQNSQVKGYIEDIDRLCRGIFYSRQINFSNKKNGYQIEGSEYYSYPSRWQRLYIRDAPEWPDYFEAALKIS
mgnify:CR=1 FL=1